MSTRREKTKVRNSQINKQLAEDTDMSQSPDVIYPRKEKFADYLIDVSKYVLTGVVITSLFNDVTNKTFIYIIGIFVVITSLWAGLRLTSKKKIK